MCRVWCVVTVGFSLGVNEVAANRHTGTAVEYGARQGTLNTVITGAVFR